MGVEVNIRMELPEEMAEHVSSATGEFENIETYVRELIRRDMEDADLKIVASHAEELRHAFAVPESEAVAFDRDMFFERMRKRHGQ